jgi:hypothetical protein
MALESADWPLPGHHWRILNALLACRTAQLGGHRYKCQECGRSHFVPHSCRNRHCPVCQGEAAHAWLEQQESALLPVPYFHLVFTLPHALNPLMRQNQRVLYTLLFESASRTLLEFGQQRLGGQLGITAVLHTWSQTLRDHYHLHCIVSGGAIRADAKRWVAAQGHYLFPVAALSVMFRGKFCSGLERLYREGKLEFYGQLAALGQEPHYRQLLKQVARKGWVVYAKRPFAGPRQVLAYLSRYTHRVAISPQRLLKLDKAAGTVTFRWKDYAAGAQQRVMTLGLREFGRRFCLHLLPQRFVKIRHFGFLSNCQRKAKVALARALLGEGRREPVSVPELAPSTPPAQWCRVCPHCGSKQVVLVEIVEASTTGHELAARLDSS